MLSKIAFALGLLLMINVEAVSIKAYQEEDTENGGSSEDTNTDEGEQCNKDGLMIKTGELNFDEPC